MVLLYKIFALILLTLQVKFAFSTGVQPNSDVLAITLNRTSIRPLYETRFLNTEFNITGQIPDNYSLTILVDDERIAIVYENATLQLPNGESLVEGAFRMQGKRLGLGILSFYLHPNEEDPISGENSTLLLSGIEVIVLRLPQVYCFHIKSTSLSAALSKNFNPFKPLSAVTLKSID